jgi:hypothetical protein
VIAVIARNRRDRKGKIYRGFTQMSADQRNIARIAKIAEIEKQNQKQNL